MSDKETYQKKMQAQLDEWKTEIGKLKTKAAGAGEKAAGALNDKIKTLEEKVAQGKTKLKELAGATEEAWESIKDGMESLWAFLKKNVKETVDKLDKEADKEDS
jgi:septal ring factor EnvC (AmiA/AmiB activator)